MGKKLQTFEEWLKGNISMSDFDFSTKDLIRINEKQHEIYNNAINQRVEELDIGFETDFSNSIMPKKYLDNRIEDYDDLFFGNPNHFMITNENGVLSSNIKRQKLREIFEMRVQADQPNITLLEYSDISKCLTKNPEFKEIIETEARYKHYMQLKSLSNQDSAKNNEDELTTRQQILILYYLSENQIIDLKKLHPDLSGQARLLHSLLNRNEDNFYKNYRQVRSPAYKDIYFTYENLLVIKKVFLNAEQDEIVKEIDKELSQIKKNKI